MAQGTIMFMLWATDENNVQPKCHPSPKSPQNCDHSRKGDVNIQLIYFWDSHPATLFGPVTEFSQEPSKYSEWLEDQILVTSLIISQTALILWHSKNRWSVFPLRLQGPQVLLPGGSPYQVALVWIASIRISHMNILILWGPFTFLKTLE